MRRVRKSYTEILGVAPAVDHHPEAAFLPLARTLLFGQARRQQQDATEQLSGPAWKVAFKEDQPTSAAVGVHWMRALP